MVTDMGAMPETILARKNTLFRQIENNQLFTEVFQKMGPTTKSGTNCQYASRWNKLMNTR
jgi:hypothetical protein